MNLDKELYVAIEAVSKGCRLSRSVQNRVDSVEKGDRTPVTMADLGTQCVISMELMENLPGCAVVGEEDAAIFEEHEELKLEVLDLVEQYMPGTNTQQMINALEFGSIKDIPDRFWVLDPIDGTKGFLRGDQYAIALGLVVDGEVVLGVLGCPNYSGGLYYAVKDGGAFVQSLENGVEQPIHVDDIQDAALATFCESVEKAHAAHDDHARIAEILGMTQPPFRMDSQCKYAAVAQGDASIYLRLPSRKDYRECIWDHAAGSIIVQEAGGKVTDCDGKALDYTAGRRLTNNRGIIATNGNVHDALLAAVKKVI